MYLALSLSLWRLTDLSNTIPDVQIKKRIDVQKGNYKEKDLNFVPYWILYTIYQQGVSAILNKSRVGCGFRCF